MKNLHGLLCFLLFINMASADDRPNIVLAIADDWGWPHASAYGDPVVKTPTFDRLAKEGVLFNHAYVSSPSCTPSRNAILTGQFHWRLGHGANLWSQLDPDTPVYPHLLKEAGYHIGSWRKSYGPGKLDGWSDHPAGQPGKGFEAFLKARPAGAPFCFWLGASDPHRGYKRDSGKDSGMDLSKIKLPACFPDSEMVRGDVADYYFEVQRFDRDVGNVVAKLEEMGELDNTIILMTGDHGMPFPRCKGNLYDTGARVCLAARWGEKVKPGQVVDAFISTTDFAPTFLEAAGVKIPSQMTGRSLVGLMTGGRTENRSFVLTGKERHTPCQEKGNGDGGGTPMRAIRNHQFLYIVNYEPSRWPAGTPNWRKAFVAGGWLGDCDNGPTKTYMVDYKDKDDIHRRLYELSFGKRPRQELYDLRNDPDQLVNVYNDPEYASVIKELDEQLTVQLKNTKDPRVVGEGAQFDAYPYYGGIPKFPGVGKKKKK